MPGGYPLLIGPVIRLNAPGIRSAQRCAPVARSAAARDVSEYEYATPSATASCPLPIGIGSVANWRGGSKAGAGRLVGAGAPSSAEVDVVPGDSSGRTGPLPHPEQTRINAAKNTSPDLIARFLSPVRVLTFGNDTR